MNKMLLIERETDTSFCSWHLLKLWSVMIT